jgi:hypothetical protein
MSQREEVAMVKGAFACADRLVDMISTPKETVHVMVQVTANVRRTIIQSL